MKELNDDIDKLFRETIESNTIRPSDAARHSLNNRLDKQLLEKQKRLTSRYQLISAALLLLLFTLAAFEYLGRNRSNILAQHPRSKSETSVTVVNEKDLKKENRQTESPAVNSGSGIHPSSAPVYTFAGHSEPQTEKKNQTLFSGKKPEDRNQHVLQTSENTGSTPGSGSSADIVIAAASHPDATNEPAAPHQSEISKPVVAASEHPNQSLTPDGTPETEPATTNVSEGIVKKSISDSPPATSSSENRTSPPLTSDPATEKKNNRFSLTAFYAPELDNRLYTKDNDSDDQKNTNDDDYKEREAAGYSFSTGLKGGYSLNEHWTFFAGLEYLAVSQRISPLTVYSEPTEPGARHYVLNTSSGSAELPNTGVAPTATDSLMLNSSTLALKFINIPLIAQYGIRKKRFLWYGFAGVSLNYLVAEKLIVELPNNNGGADLYTIRNLNGTNKFNLGLVAGLGMGYSISERFSLHLEPGFKGMLTAVNSNTAVKSYPYSMGLNVGLTYHL
jgi:hypothetical protein